MRVITSPEAMTAWSVTERAQGHTVGLVPTMGFLHRGHASLMDALRPDVDQLVVSIYVNPLQFGAGEDLDRYPRDLSRDREVCEAHDVDVIFAPADLYPEGFQTSVSVHGLTDGLCGARRPGHFEGVCTVVARLFGLTRCTHAIFGEKDYQQLAVLRRMVTDLALPVTVVGGALVRDDDGVALSSRNKFLSASDRVRAQSLRRALAAVVDDAQAGERDVATLRARALALLTVDRVDYLDVVDAGSLAPLTTLSGPARVAVAAFVGDTRLIDNMAVAQ